MQVTAAAALSKGRGIGSCGGAPGSGSGSVAHDGVCEVLDDTKSGVAVAAVDAADVGDQCVHSRIVAGVLECFGDRPEVHAGATGAYDALQPAVAGGLVGEGDAVEVELQDKLVGQLGLLR